ncbi:hypothetical protein [Glutamicibacter endophyticus]|uniref:hypothetical protein n=1 Tax=Glutamicibacter endophyticus TaxID=1522174 RepID=UPI003AEF567A
MAISSHPDVQGGDQPESLVAALTLIFQDTSAQEAEQAVRSVLAQREVIALVSRPVPWNGLVIVEVGIAVNAEGLILLTTAEGNVRLGQQVEDFALALKLGTGALYVDQDDLEAQSGEPIADPRLEATPSGRTVLTGKLNEADMLILASATKATWHLLESGESEGSALAVCDEFMPDDGPGADQYPAIMFSRSGARYVASFWFSKQSKKLLGAPAWVHIWPVMASAAIQPEPGTEALRELQALESHYVSVDVEGLEELSGVGVTSEHIEVLKRVLPGFGSQQAVEQVLAGFGYRSEAAELLEQSGAPTGSVAIQSVGFAKALGRATATEMRKSSATPSFFNTMSWRPGLQLLWGLLEAAIFTFVLVGIDWQQLWLPAWLLITILVLGYLDALTNVVIAVVRGVRRRRRA